MSTCRGMINFKQGWLDINKFLNTKNWLLWVRLRKYVLNFLFKCFMWRQEEPVHAVQDLRHSGIWEESIILTVSRPASYGAGIRGKPIGGFPPNPLSLVLTEGSRGSHRVAPMMPKGEAFRTAFPNFSS